MYFVTRTKNFEKSFKRLKRSGKLKKQAKDTLVEVIDILTEGKKLPSVFRDHQLTGDFVQYRECHIKGDLLLVYQIRKNELVLVLIDIGTHSYLGL